jgi:hypothetical protein
MRVIEGSFMMSFYVKLDNLAAETAASMTIAHQITHSWPLELRSQFTLEY